MPDFDGNFAALDTVPTDMWLPEGEWDCLITEPVGKMSANNYPELDVVCVRADGAKRTAWLVYNSEFGARKVVSLGDAAGIPRPTPENGGVVDGMLSPRWIAALGGKSVKVYVRARQDDPGKLEIWNFSKADGPVTIGAAVKTSISAKPAAQQADPFGNPSLAEMGPPAELFAGGAAGAMADDDIPF